MSRKWVTEADEYVCNLSLEDQETAKNELREDEASRTQALQSFRHWIMKNPRIENCRLDANFLLRFLRFKKFSVPQAEEALERYLLLRQTFSIAFRNLDVRNTRINEILDRGVVFSSPHRDSLGRRLIIARPGQFDPYKYNKEDVCKLAAIIHESTMEDERSQVNGFLYFCDADGFGFPYLTLFTPKEAVRIVKNGERTVPVRHKEGHGINCPSTLKFAMDFGMSIISDKYKKRVFVHENREKALENLDRKLLPIEYGGDVPMIDMITSFKNELEKVRDRVLDNDRMGVRLEFYNERAKEGAVYALKNGMFCKGEEDFYNKELCGNFRKLQVSCPMRPSRQLPSIHNYLPTYNAYKAL